MGRSKELNKIKAVYGENFMHMCRRLFPTILEEEGKLYEILSNTFSNTCTTLYEDIQNTDSEMQFANFIEKKAFPEEANKIERLETRTPYEILEEVGYDLYECKNEREIQTFKKYYYKDEELCTFQGGRLNDCIVFFAVKKDVDNIKRKVFKKPEREDEYGTSVMSIQFPRGASTRVSIKNRYNHTVENPDATYGNDLDKIAPGLAQSFKDLLQERGLNLEEPQKIKEFPPGWYIVANDGKFYRRNNFTGTSKICCQGNIIIDKGNVRKLDQNKQILIENFIVDMEDKTVKCVDEGENFHDSFVDSFTDIEKIIMEKDKENKEGNRIISVYKKGVEEPILIKINKSNVIIGYKNSEITTLKNNFLSHNYALKELHLPKLEAVGDSFLENNDRLEELALPSLKEVEDNFLFHNSALKELHLPKLEAVGNCFLGFNNQLEELHLPKLEEVGNYFLGFNNQLEELHLPKLEEVGNDFLVLNNQLEKLHLPKLEAVGDNFLMLNNQLEELHLPKLEVVGNCFLQSNNRLEELALPSLKEAGDNFLHVNNRLEKLALPSLEKVGYDFLLENTNLKHFYAPNLQSAREGFFANNTRLRKRKPILKKIARLVKEKHITTSEIKEAKGVIQELSQGKEQGKKER